MTKEIKYLIIGGFLFLLAIHSILNFSNDHWMVVIIALPPTFGYWLLFALGVGCSMRSILLRSDRRIIESASEETIPKKGDRIAVRGAICPDNAQLSAPFSGKACVLYEYHIFKGKKHPEAVGWAFVPSFVKNERGMIRLSDYPKLMVEDFYEKGTTKLVPPQFVQQTRFKKLNRVLTFLLPEVLALIPSLSWLLFFEPPREDGEIRTDIDYRNKDEDFSADKIEERIVAPGAPVIAIGEFDPQRGALVAGWIGLRLIPDSGLKQIRESFRGEIIIWTIAGFFLPDVGWLLP